MLVFSLHILGILCYVGFFPGIWQIWLSKSNIIFSDLRFLDADLNQASPAYNLVNLSVQPNLKFKTKPNKHFSYDSWVFPHILTSVTVTKLLWKYKVLSLQLNMILIERHLMINLRWSGIYGKDKEIIIVVKIIYKAIIQIFAVKITFILLNPSMWQNKTRDERCDIVLSVLKCCTL